MQCSPPDSRNNRQHGFTLIEMLIAMAVASLILLIGTQLLVGAAQTQGREEITVPVQESVRGAMEVLAMDLREAAGPRIVSSAAPLPDTPNFQSTASQVTVVHLNPSNAFRVVEPQSAGVPGSMFYLPYPQRLSTPVTVPNDFSNTCAQVFAGSEYAMLMNSASYTWTRVTGCGATTGAVTTLNHSALPPLNWTNDTRIAEIDVTQYRLATVNGTPSLMRSSIISGVATDQVVAFDITAFNVSYSADGQTFSTAPTAVPVAVKVQITGQSSLTRAGARTTTPYTLTNVVFMRQTTMTPPANP